MSSMKLAFSEGRISARNSADQLVRFGSMSGVDIEVRTMGMERIVREIVGSASAIFIHRHLFNQLYKGCQKIVFQFDAHTNIGDEPVVLSLYSCIAPNLILDDPANGSLTFNAYTSVKNGKIGFLRLAKVRNRSFHYDAGKDYGSELDDSLHRPEANR